MATYELRVYTAVPGKMPALLSRFENETLKIWEGLGIRQLGFWTTLVGPNSNELTYILVWDSLSERERKVNAFAADAEWIETRAKTEREAGGAIVEKIANLFLSPTGFSALR
ncbi:hypothetical protein CLAFUW4_14488 [Fulvia fulva]|uniref:NIPSNAP domain-containing protein n=1 Tax=Passalora fulva TaxID=5499 RepID=A0A9Q8PMU4_PASFU|nr:uncharacterized protein CLAFUR5_14320 [Fulvia fulva]KAK4609274.1 hypothetical protein CLAFUR4_14483 [Fulvia fulva]KAK4609474.1 hypothetical protein CLAFUR0_14485 [Fulvia fulva]UJO25333.1 hypothetical protein CLAFUR5_14320 [Fulvia fulva]WPV22452.1 hypothetical protein CLAFUW4_14488 [Fulvia fulva]WPV37451.1 hypothetical protein CLAFUW7_14492 [Fulvia fulva]